MGVLSKSPGSITLQPDVLSNSSLNQGSILTHPRLDPRQNEGQPTPTTAEARPHQDTSRAPKDSSKPTTPENEGPGRLKGKPTSSHQGRPTQGSAGIRPVRRRQHAPVLVTQVRDLLFELRSETKEATKKEECLHVETPVRTFSAPFAARASER